MYWDERLRYALKTKSHTLDAITVQAIYLQANTQTRTSIMIVIGLCFGFVILNLIICICIEKLIDNYDERKRLGGE